MAQVEEQSPSCLSPPELERLDGLRVLHVGKFYPPHQGGMETHLQTLCGELKQAINVEVVVAGDERETVEETIDGVSVTRLGTLLNLAAAPVCPQMLRRIRETRADIVHIHWPNPTAVLAYLASGHRGKLVFTYHSDIIRQKLLRKPFWPILRYALNRADAIIVSSPDYLATSPVLRMFRQRCRVIPFGIPLEKFDQADAFEVSKIREQYGGRIVLGVGRLVYYKGFEYLIRAMKDVAARLLIVGSGPLHQELEREARACGVSERVRFLTNIREVAPYYHAASLFALSSVARSEAFGITQLEAMACGKPVVNTKLDSGVPFVSPDGLTGLTVPPANAGALGQAINTLLDDPTLSAEYGRAGRRRVEQEFNLEVMTRRTLQVYEDVMKNSQESGV
jgi:glycosyltransferase involved in cell wall biosynthesis